MNKAQIENKSISLGAVVACSFSFVSEFCFMIPNLQVGFKDSPNWVFYVQTIGLVVGSAILSLIIYRISVSMAQSDPSLDWIDDDSDLKPDGFSSSINDLEDAQQLRCQKTNSNNLSSFKSID